MATYTFQNGDGPYPLFPTSIRPESFKINHKRTTLIADPRSMRRQTRSVGGVRIEVSIKYPLLSRSDYADFISFYRLLDGRSSIFAFRMPLLRDDSSYTDTDFKVGEYYNASDGNNELVQYLGVGAGVIVDPPFRSGSALSPHSVYRPTLKASLNTDGPSVEYGGDNFIRYSMNLVERW